MEGRAVSGAPADYIDVAERLRELRSAHPEGCVRVLDPARPYTIETVGDRTFIVVVAACYRTPDDPTPGVGMAWEPFPGPTNFTRDSELQNAETSAWGRAIVATLIADTKRVASSDEVRNRQPGVDPNIVESLCNAYEALPGDQRPDLAEIMGYALKSTANAAAALKRLHDRAAELQGVDA